MNRLLAERRDKQTVVCWQRGRGKHSVSPANRKLVQEEG